MIRLQRLYTEPQYFKPIIFTDGINLIIGDKSEGSRKTNGVGKTMCIEFINFCLLKDKKDSRVLKIPEKQFPLDVKIILDLQINNKQLTIIRTLENPDKITIINSKEESFLNSTSEASKYLQNLLFINQPNKSVFPSFRQLLSPLMRDERSEFKDLINSFDTKKRIPPDYIPHLYFLGIDISIYKDYKNVYKDIETQAKLLSELNKAITEDGNLNIKDVRAKLNALEDEVKRLNTAIEDLRTNESYNSIHKDLVSLETDLETLRTRQKAIRYEIKKIESLPKPENISKTEISILYNQFKQGLGEFIEKSLSEMENFKAKIDNFRNTLVNNKLETLKGELNILSIKIGEKDKAYSDKIKSIDNGKILKDIKTGISIYNKKSEELNKIRYQITSYDEAFKHRRDVLKPRLDQLKLDINRQIEDCEQIKKSFEQTILDIHEVIMNSREASFNIETKNSSKRKDYIDFEMRIKDDGSHSVERTKVFIYDVALMFNEYTKQRHPGLLIHDNIFDVDQDTLVQCLNYMSKQEEQHPSEFQYILTINRDKIENEERQSLINLDIVAHRKANFTKTNRFLGIQYKEK
jgi:uncharacterized protein YydD (DUF2326 family)